VGNWGCPGKTGGSIRAFEKFRKDFLPEPSFAVDHRTVFVCAAGRCRYFPFRQMPGFLHMMKFSALILLAMVCLAGATGCKRAVPYRGPKPEKPVAFSYADHPAGSDLQALIDDFKLDRADVRYRQGMPDHRKSAVYFMIEGNLHVESQRVENGDWVLLSTPYLEPSDKPVEERLAKWDGSIEPEGAPHPQGKR
jgi:hypothetical protein